MISLDDPQMCVELRGEVTSPQSLFLAYLSGTYRSSRLKRVKILPETSQNLERIFPLLLLNFHYIWDQILALPLTPSVNLDN